MGYYFGLKDVKIATYTAVESFGSAVDVVSVSMANVELQTVNGTLEGDDRITDAHAMIISGTARIRFGFNNLNVMNVLTGETHTQSADRDSMIFNAGTSLPFFALCGRVDNTDAAGDLQFFAPKCKLMEGFSFSFQYGQYVTPELTVTFLDDDGAYGAAKFIQHDTAQSVTIPPT